MAFRTVLKYGTDPSLQTLQGVIEKEGKPATITLQGLSVQTTHYAQAELYKDGWLQATSQNIRFTTLADSITLTFAQYRRQVDGTHKITYNYTSTYALTSAILYWDITAQRQGTCQGQIDSTNHVITFDVPNGESNGGMDGNGATYTIRAKGWDVYAVEGISADTSITTSTMNNVSITATATGQTTVDVVITKFLDSGWQSGVVKWWGENDDPATDTPLGSAAIQESTATYTVTGLTQGTTYQFRADITTASPSTTVGCAIVSATTAADWASTAFTITNNASSQRTLTLKKSTQFTPNNGLYVRRWETRKSGASTWSSTDCSGSDRTITLNAGQSVEIRARYIHDTGPSNYQDTPLFEFQYAQGGNWEVSGNVGSLLTPNWADGQWTNIDQTKNNLSNLFTPSSVGLTTAEHMVVPNIPSYGICLFNAFNGQTALVTPPDTSRVTDVRGYNEGSEWSRGMFESMFENCTSLATPPNLSGVTTVHERGMRTMFANCTSLATLPNLSAIARVYSYGCKGMFSGCTSMTGTPVFAALTRVDTYGMELMFENTGLTGGANLSGVITDGNYAFQQMYTWSTNLSKPGALPNIAEPSEGSYSNMYNSCFSLTAPPRMGHITTIGRFVCDGMFGGCSSLATAPDLTKVVRIGYYGCSAMFMSCTALQTGADIRRATGYDTGMIADMYNGCTRLTTAYLPTPTDVNQFWSQCEPTNWLASVAASGRVIAANQTMLDGAPRDSASGIPSGWTGVVQAV